MKSNSTPVPLDATDIRILDQLQRDAGMTNQELAAQTHTSPATCLRRVRRLTDAGVIERRVALLDASLIGQQLTAIAEVTLDRQGAEHLQRFEARAVGHQAVRQCYRVSPGPDFVLLLCVAHMTAWARVVEELFTQDANVRNVKTYFVVERAKFETAAVLPGAEATRRAPNESTGEGLL